MDTLHEELPQGFVVRLHDDVEISTHMVAGSRVLKVSAVARRLLAGRTLTVDAPASRVLAGRLLDLDLADPLVEDCPSRLNELTVVVPVRDNPVGVGRLLAAIGSEVACVVVDDASTEPQTLAEVVADHGAHLVRLDHNVGPASARNAGLREVGTTLVAFVDSDVMVTTGALAGLTRHFSDPRLAAVAPRVMTANGERWFQRFEAAHGSLDLGPVPATLRPWSPVSYVPTACLVARVDLLSRGFDPQFRSGEDVDLVWRLQADGHRVRYAAEVSAHHDPRATAVGWLGRKFFYGTSAAPLATRHGDMVAPAAMTTAGAAAVVGVLLQRRWSWAVTAGCLAWMAHDSRRRLPELSSSQRLDVVRAAGYGLGRQTAGLALRHWWPATLLLAAVSPRARRAVALMAVAEAVVAHHSSTAQLSLLRFAAARRADDLAYGAGVWWGVARTGSVRCLLPKWGRP